MGYHMPKTEVVCKRYSRKKLRYQITPTYLQGPHDFWCFTFQGQVFGCLGFWHSRVMLKMPLEPHCNNSSQTDVRSSHISSQRQLSPFEQVVFSFAVLQFHPILFIQQKILFTRYLLLLSISLCYCIRSIIHFILLINLDQWYQRGLLFIYFSSCMSPTRFGYTKLGL